MAIVKTKDIVESGDIKGLKYIISVNNDFDLKEYVLDYLSQIDDELEYEPIDIEQIRFLISNIYGAFNNDALKLYIYDPKTMKCDWISYGDGAIPMHEMSDDLWNYETYGNQKEYWNKEIPVYINIVEEP